jgi:membrane-bound lytic murein transglycosylase D
VERSRLFHHDVVSLIRLAGLPPEIAAIPIVESNWRVDAVSSSAAGGPWQFLESSARGRDLRMDVWHDERRDPWRSTEAAIKELSFYRRLQGDWLLAIASYNAGPTRIRRIRETSGVNDFWMMLKAGVLPPETRGYVPQIMAVAYIAAHEGRLGFETRWEKPPEWFRLPLERSILLSDLAKAADMDLNTIQQLHPELHFPVTPPPGSSYRIKIPVRSKDDVLNWLQELEDTQAPLRFWRYTVKNGDTLSVLAEKTGVSLDELVRYNAKGGNTALRAGERLLLPGDTELPEGSDTDLLPNWQGRYRVVAGDSLWSVARRFGITPEKLAEANHRPVHGVLLSGSVLQVPEAKVD